MRASVVFAFAIAAGAYAAACGGRVSGNGDESSQNTDAGVISDAGARPKKDAGVSLGACPGGLPGPTLAPATTTSGEPYCIDSTEVTNADYKAFLATKPDPISQALACSKNNSFTPPFNWPTSAEDDNRPVVNVDWCDAKAFCEWAGKELCGAPGGAEAPAHDYQNADTSLWFSACSLQGTSTFPYGNDYQPKTCNGADYDTAYTLDVDQPPTCVVTKESEPQLYDFSGNVWEWENACEGEGPTDRCRVRGGSFRSNLASLTCAASTMATRDSLFDDFGFRCCVE